MPCPHHPDPGNASTIHNVHLSVDGHIHTPDHYSEVWGRDAAIVRALGGAEPYSPCEYWHAVADTNKTRRYALTLSAAHPGGEIGNSLMPFLPSRWEQGTLVLLPDIDPATPPVNTPLYPLDWTITVGQPTVKWSLSALTVLYRGLGISTRPRGSNSYGYNEFFNNPLVAIEYLRAVAPFTSGDIHLGHLAELRYPTDQPDVPGLTPDEVRDWARHRIPVSSIAGWMRLNAPLAVAAAFTSRWEQNTLVRNDDTYRAVEAAGFLTRQGKTWDEVFGLLDTDPDWAPPSPQNNPVG